MLEAELHRSSISHSTEYCDTLNLDESLRLTAAGVLVAEHKPPSQRARENSNHDEEETVKMASVSSLDKDLRNLRLGKYTPQAASEVRRWIENVLGEPLVPGDLLDALKDGTALCKYDAMLRPT